ncbi:MAG: response regulator [Bacillota bacterium]|nr:two-component system response regulator [Bacillota bacterium]HWR57146.1 response regulator [Negativicutes bacterium]
MNGNITIMVIDDQPGIRRLLAEVLQEDGYNVAIAANGYDALHKVKEITPQLILMDMKMPGMDGLETFRELKKAGKAERVIMMTAYGELELVKEALNLGAYKYITKPFDINVIKKIVAEAVNAEQCDSLKIG